MAVRWVKKDHSFELSEYPGKAESYFSKNGTKYDGIEIRFSRDRYGHLISESVSLIVDRKLVGPENEQPLQEVYTRVMNNEGIGDDDKENILEALKKLEKGDRTKGVSCIVISSQPA